MGRGEEMGLIDAIRRLFHRDESEYLWINIYIDPAAVSSYYNSYGSSEQNLNDLLTDVVRSYSYVPDLIAQPQGSQNKLYSGSVSYSLYGAPDLSTFWLYVPDLSTLYWLYSQPVLLRKKQ